MDSKIIEINGVKMEIMPQEIKTIQHFKVGERVKLFKKEYSSWKVMPAIITGITVTDDVSILEILGLIMTYSDVKVERIILTSADTAREVFIAKIDDYEFNYSQDTAIELLDKNIDKALTAYEGARLAKQIYWDNFLKPQSE